MQFVPAHRHTDNIVESHCHCQWVPDLQNFSLRLIIIVAVWCTVSDSLRQTSQVKRIVHLVNQVQYHVWIVGYSGCSNATQHNPGHAAEVH